MKQNEIMLNTMATKILNIIRRIIVISLILPVRAYQYLISPLTPASCRHIPTCSEYAIEALKVHGVIKGSYLAVHRILRCNPWGTSGYDPVPPQTLKVKNQKSR
jgi:uncharacterized protein